MTKNMLQALICLIITAAAPSSLAGEWYRGDLHAHSSYSGGDSSVAEVIARAEDIGLDFFTLTDHDTSLGGNPGHWYDSGYHSDSMALLYGMEWTTLPGHANIWAAFPFTYEAIWEANRAQDPVSAIAAAHKQGALFSINHPVTPFTSSWKYPVPEDFDAVEVWNAPYRLPSLNMLAGDMFWDDLLKSNRRVTGVGGSDEHMLQGWMSLFWGPGNPTTWVYADELTPEAILAGIRAGHVSISYAPGAPRLGFSADADADGTDEVMAGDAVAGGSARVLFTVGVSVPEGSSLQLPFKTDELDAAIVKSIPLWQRGIQGDFLINATNPHQPSLAKGGGCLAAVYKNGSLFRAWLLSGGGGSFSFSDIPSGAGYYRVELIGDPEVLPGQGLLYGNVLALTNPIYILPSE